MKMEQIECSETSTYKIQTPGNHPEENIQHTVLNIVICILSLPLHVCGIIHCVVPPCRWLRQEEICRSTATCLCIIVYNYSTVVVGIYTVTSRTVQNLDNFESVVKIYADTAMLQQEGFLSLAFANILKQSWV
jgi:hypothetical protein